MYFIHRYFLFSLAEAAQQQTRDERRHVSRRTDDHANENN